MPDCTRPTQHYEDDLKAYTDGELPLLRRFDVRRHLTHCASCREEISAMTQLTEELRSSESDTPLPAGLRERILQEAGKEPTPAQAPTLPKREGEEFLLSDVATSRTPAPRVRWALACAVFLFLFAGLVVLTMSHTGSVNAPQASLAEPAAMPPVSYQQRAARLPTGKLNAAAANPALPPLSMPNAPDVPARQVHKEASIAVQVANPEAASDAVEAQVTESGGFVVNNTLSTNGDALKNAELVVKVPVTQFDTFLRQVAKLGSVQSKNITGEDITEQTSDAGQTENVLEDDVKQSEARLNALGTKAKWSDMQSARDLRIQLAQAQARLVLLKRMAALSTITIDLTQTPKATVVPPVTGGFLTGLKDTTHDALQSLLSSGGALLALVIWLLAYAPLWIPAYFVGRYALKEYRKRQAAV